METQKFDANQFLGTIWGWLDGNKTIVGLVLLQAIQSGLFPEGQWLEWAKLFAMLLTGGGLAHKVLKGVKNTG